MKNPSMTSPTAALENQLAQYVATTAVIDAEIQCIVTAKQELAGRELMIDLRDTKALASFMQAETIVRLGGNDERGRLREEKGRVAKAALIESCHEFIKTVLKPQLQELRLRMQSRMRMTLADSFSAEPHADFTDASPLSDAVDNSDQGRELAALENLATVRGDSSNSRGPIAYVQELLHVWKDATVIEKNHLK